MDRFTILHKFVMSKLYHLYNVNYIDGVEIRSYWKLKHPRIYKGVVCIPMSLYRIKVLDQKALIRDYWRKAFALRIK